MFSAVDVDAGVCVCVCVCVCRTSLTVILQAQYEEFDSRTGLERHAVKRSVATNGRPENERGRIVERRKQGSGEEAKFDTLLNLQESEIDQFDADWRRRADEVGLQPMQVHRGALTGTGMRDQRRVAAPTQPPLGLLPPPSSPDDVSTNFASSNPSFFGPKSKQ